MYIYHALINALSAHMIHIKLKRILYTCRAQSPQRFILFYMPVDFFFFLQNRYGVVQADIHIAASHSLTLCLTLMLLLFLCFSANSTFQQGQRHTRLSENSHQRADSTVTESDRLQVKLTQAHKLIQLTVKVEGLLLCL